jgi:hypothetical protein
MTVANIRLKLQDYVANGDDRLVKLMYAIAKEYTEAETDHPFSKEDIALFEDRRAKRLSGESKLHSWDEAKAMITGKKSA